MKVFGYRNDHIDRYANIELPNGDRVHVRVGLDQVKVAKLWLGHIPLKVLWAATGPKEMGRLSYAAFGTNLLDAVIERIRPCHCAADIRNLAAGGDA